MHAREPRAASTGDGLRPTPEKPVEATTDERKPPADQIEEIPPRQAVGDGKNLVFAHGQKGGPES